MSPPARFFYEFSSPYSYLAAGAEDVKARLRANTAAAVAAGVTGVPTVAVGDTLFWGDDRLEDAAAAKG